MRHVNLKENDIVWETVDTVAQQKVPSPTNSLRLLEGNFMASLTTKNPINRIISRHLCQLRHGTEWTMAIIGWDSGTRVTPASMNKCAVPPRWNLPEKTQVNCTHQAETKLYCHANLLRIKTQISRQQMGIQTSWDEYICCKTWMCWQQTIRDQLKLIHSFYWTGKPESNEGKRCAHKTRSNKYILYDMKWILMGIILHHLDSCTPSPYIPSQSTITKIMILKLNSTMNTFLYQETHNRPVSANKKKK